MNPTEAQIWIKEVEKAFKICDVRPEQKTVFATYLLKGEATYWWEGIEQMEMTRRELVGREDEGIPWERFKELFFEKYFSTSIADEMEVQFLELKQDNLTVAEYEMKFNELARFAPHQVNTERRKAKRFERGLQPWIYNKVAVLEMDTFAKVVEKAKIAEAGSNMLMKYNKEKRNSNKEAGKRPQSGQPIKQEWSSNVSKKRVHETDLSGSSQKKSGTICSQCGKNHGHKPCLKGKGVCFRCGQPGHVVQNCPMNQLAG